MDIDGGLLGGVASVGNMFTNAIGSFMGLQNQKAQQRQDEFYRKWYALLDLQQFENVKDMQAWQKQAWEKEYEYNKMMNDRNFELATNAAQYRAQDLVNAGMSPLLAAGSSAVAPQTLSAPSAGSMPTGSGRGGSYSSSYFSNPLSGLADAFLKFGELANQTKLVNSQVELNKAKAGESGKSSEFISVQSEYYTKLKDKVDSDVSNIESQTKLNNARVLEVFSHISNMDSQSILNFSNVNKNNVEIKRILNDLEISKVKLQLENILLDYCKVNNIPAEAVNSDSFKFINIVKAYSTLAEGKRGLDSTEYAITVLFGPNQKGDLVRYFLSGAVDLFTKGTNLLSEGWRKYNDGVNSFYRYVAPAFKSAFGGH